MNQSGRMTATREALAFEAFTVMDEEQWIVDAALAEVEEWETRLAELKACWGADGVRVVREQRAINAQVVRRAEAAEAERDEWKREAELSKWPKEAAQEYHRLKHDYPLLEAERDKFKGLLKRATEAGHRANIREDCGCGNNPCPNVELINTLAAARAALGEQT